MKTRSLFAVLIGMFLLLNSYTQTAPPYQWAKQAGGTSNDYCYGSCMDAAGNIYLTGGFGGNASFGTVQLTGSGVDLFVAKYNSAGTVVWATAASAASYKISYAIGIDDSSNVYIAGSFGGTVTFGTTTLVSAGNDDILIAKLDPAGNFVWAKRAGSTASDEAFGLAVDGDGNCYVTGKYNLACVFGTDTLHSAGSVDAFIAKYDRNGNVVYVKSKGGPAADVGWGIAIDTTGNAYVIGNFGQTMTLDTISITSYGVYDVFVAKFDTTGRAMWADGSGSATYDDFGNAIALDASGSIYITGSFRGTATFGSTTLGSLAGFDIFIGKYSNSGNLLWVKREGGNSISATANIRDEGHGILAHDSTIYFTGNYYCDALFDTTHVNGLNEVAYILNMDTAGTMRWMKTASNDAGWGRTITANSMGDVYLAGYFRTADADFDSLNLHCTSYNYTQIFLAKIGDFTTSVPSQHSSTSEIQAWPNPSEGKFHLTTTSPVKSLRVYAITGQLVHEEEYFRSGMLDLSVAPDGIYFLVLTDENGVVSTEKIVVRR